MIFSIINTIIEVILCSKITLSGKSIKRVKTKNSQPIITAINNNKFVIFILIPPYLFKYDTV